MIALFVLPALASLRDWSGFTFDDFKATYRRTFTDNVTEAQRRLAFENNHAGVLRHNREYAAGASTWWASINEFSDLAEQEFHAQKKGLSPTAGSSVAAALPFTGSLKTSTPDRKDWRDRTPSIVTQVKNQRACGSCWAFASTAVIESYYALNTGSLSVLAPQTLVNCAPNPHDCGGTGGCEGSIPELAFNFTKQSGIALESDLPYKAHDEACTHYKAKATLTGYVKLPGNSAAALESALASVGPVAVNVAANWMSYGGGIFSGGCKEGSSCTLDHVVVAMGYEKPRDGNEGYWLIRNSWGTSWGEAGYIRLSRKFDETTFVDRRPADGVACKPFPKAQNVTGESGVLLDMSYPIGVRTWA